MITASIVIPTHNRKISLKDTLRSLFELEYPKEEYEILVCDDDSTDGTSEMVQDMMSSSPCRLKILVQKQNKGPATARNIGIKEARGSIVCFIDSDAVADKNWLKEHMKVHSIGEVETDDGEKVPADIISGVGGKIKIKNPKSRVALYSEVGRYRLFGLEQGDNLKVSPLHGHPTCNMSYKKNILEDVGLFDETSFKYAAGEDTDLGLKVALKGYQHIYNPHAVVYHRHPERILDLMRMWYRISEYEVFISKKYPNYHKVNSPFKAPNKYFMYNYWYLIPVDILVRASMVVGLMRGYCKRAAFQ